MKHCQLIAATPCHCGLKPAYSVRYSYLQLQRHRQAFDRRFFSRPAIKNSSLCLRMLKHQLAANWAVLHRLVISSQAELFSKNIPNHTSSGNHSLTWFSGPKPGAIAEESMLVEWMGPHRIFDLAYGVDWQIHRLFDVSSKRSKRNLPGLTAVRPGCCFSSKHVERSAMTRQRNGRHARSKRCLKGTMRARTRCMCQFTFHFSISSCCFLYCFNSSSKTFFRPSEFVVKAGMTSFTVFSTKTPLIMRKHFRLSGRGLSVSRTNLRARGAVST